MGAVDYLLYVRSVCKVSHEDCSVCPLGMKDDDHLAHSRCPKLIFPSNWSEEFILASVGVTGR